MDPLSLVTTQLGCIERNKSTEGDQLAEKENNNTLTCSIKNEPESLDKSPPPKPHFAIQRDSRTTNSFTKVSFGGLKAKNHRSEQQKTVMYGCKLCGQIIIGSVYSMKQHLGRHSYKMAYTCHFCRKVFGRRWSLRNHFRTHTGERPFSCSHCNRAFADKSNLHAHLDTHLNVRKYVCTKCNKGFKRLSYFKQHITGGC